jgi:hypothetical protein
MLQKKALHRERTAQWVQYADQTGQGIAQSSSGRDTRPVFTTNPRNSFGEHGQATGHERGQGKGGHDGAAQRVGFRQLGGARGGGRHSP